MSAREDMPVAAISGGTSGIGLATAIRFLRDGYRVAVFGHGEASVKSALNVLQQAGGGKRALVSQADIRDPAAIYRFFAEVRESLGAPSVFVASAGISPKAAGRSPGLLAMERDSWDEVLSINLTGAMLCCRAVLPSMQQKGFGRIILVGSLAGRTRPRIAGPAYSVSKSGLAGLSRSIVTDYAVYGITANVVAPGRILTGMTGPAASETNQMAITRIPAGRLGTVEEVAAAIAFLASHDAGFINGAILDVNGGEFAPS